MIYLRVGTPLAIIAYRGKVLVPQLDPDTRFDLVQVRDNASGVFVRHVFIGDLRADGGAGELLRALDKAPFEPLTGKDLKVAIAEAL